ncbi:MAG: response regulator [Oscillospiraceae bacterium]
MALLDIMLPGIDGFEVCRRIRAMDNKFGIIMLTARTQEMDKVTGTDDRRRRLCDQALLSRRSCTARVDALFRRAGGREEIPRPGEIVAGSLPSEHPQPHRWRRTASGSS